ncbi:fibronectin type III domain-containing protein [Exiguobacterium acetylicum]|uniref:Fibronectin type III domain-containing protein n=3 Tax=Exiguobacterium TaxID=33986 RepID=A0ABX8GEM5_EXIAC|nr:fibronectin type III domain-containing protein [Exiguobacterium acetylicum]QWB31816.1 fibronectin type III domain-containing protein [Exiguobacterium acetylicum]
MNNFNKTLCLSAISLGLLASISDETFAAESKVKAIETSSSISLSWNAKGAYHKVYEGKKLIYKGIKKKLSIKGLKPDQLYSYRVATYTKSGKLIGFSTIKTSTTKSKNQNSFNKFSANTIQDDVSSEEDAPKEVILETNVGTDYADINWGKMEDNDGVYEIYRDGDLIGSTTNLSYRDENLTPATIYTYEIVAKKEVSQEKKDEINEKIKEQNISLSSNELDGLYDRQQSIIRSIKTSENISEKELLSPVFPSFSNDSDDKSYKMSSSSISPSKRSYFFRYTTFIPDKTVKNKNFLDYLGTSYLHGDNRGYDIWSSKYRTRSDVYAGWAFGSPAIDHSPSVGQSILYKDKAGKNVIKKATASTNGIKLSKDVLSKSKVAWRVNHDVGVPFAKSYPNITYYYEGTQYSNGSMKIRGAHDNAPNHEFYWGYAYSDLTPKTVFRHTGGSFFNLVPGMKQKYFEFSM